jgi:hypothetical protein
MAWLAPQAQLQMLATQPLLFFGAIVLVTGLLWTPLLFQAGRLVMSPGAGIGLALLAAGLFLVPHLSKRPLQRLLAPAA